MGTYTPPLPKQNYITKQGPVVDAPWLNAIDNLLQGNIPASGVYNPTFQYGNLNYTGPNGYLISSSQLGYGLLPAPDSSSPPTLLLGGAGQAKAQITTDAQQAGLDGITLYLAAGSAANGTTNLGGTLWLFGGAGYSGAGGDLKLQAGTSLNATGGNVYVMGGNSTNGAAGNVYIIAGTTGQSGGNVKIYATNLQNVAGDISFWLGQPDIPHSVPLWTMSHTGALFPGNQGAGNPGDFLVSGGNLASPSWGPGTTSGQIQLTLSGGTSTFPTGNFSWAKFGNIVTLTYIDPGFLIANSNGNNDIILSALPTFLTPARDRYVYCTSLVNVNGLGYAGEARVAGAGAIYMSLLLVTPTNATTNPNASGAPIGPINRNAWGTTGQKGIASGWTLTYSL